MGATGWGQTAFTGTLGSFNNPTKAYAMTFSPVSPAFASSPIAFVSSGLAGETTASTTYAAYTGWDNTSNFFYYSVTPRTGYSLTITSINSNLRSSNTGPKSIAVETATSLTGPWTQRALSALSGTTAADVNASSLSISVPDGTTLFVRYKNTSATSANGATVLAAGTGRINSGSIVGTFSVATASPTITLNPTSLTGLTTTTGANSSVTNYTVTGTNLGATNVTVTPNSSLIEISTNASTGFATNALTLIQTGGVVSNTVYVRIANVATATNFSTTIANDSGTASSNLTVSGSVTAPPLTLVLNPTTVAENAGASASTGTVTVPSAPASNLEVNLNSANTSAATVPVSLTILAGQTSATFGVTVVQNSSSYDDQSSLITASASNYTSDTETLRIANTDKRPMTVVINKYINATPDKAELLVVGNSTPGQTVDMRGMIFKDFSGSMAGDGGAQYTFTTSTLWAAVPVGTLIVLSNDNTAGDTDPADFKLGVGLNNTIYFTKTGGTFDIAATEMLMVKVAGSSAAGTSGGIHALAGGTAGTYYTDFVGYKLNATGTTGTDQGVYANNSIGVLTDFDGTDATGTVAKTDVALTFGAASTAGNATFIASLRGTDPTDGSGAVTLANSTAGSPYALSPIFAREATDQSVSLNLTGILADKTISDVTVLVPELLGLPLVSNVTLTGTGAASAEVTVNGQLITVTGAAVTTTASMTINVSGLSTPALANLSSNLGNLPFTVSTARAGGSLKALVASPSAFVLMPIETIRAKEASGTPTYNGNFVAVEGVCTDTLTATGTAPAFLQDGDYGVAISSSAITKAFAKGTRYAVAGTVGSSNGLTNVNPLSLSAIVELGSGTLPTPRVITLPLSFDDAEKYEGSLVQIANLSKSSTELEAWGASSTITATDGTNTIDIRIQQNSTATAEPGYPATITGILGQYDTSLPRSSGYQIMPRTPEDLSFVPQLKFAWSVPSVVILENGDGFDPSIIFLTVSRIGSSAGTTAVDISISPTGRMLNNGSALPQTINFAAGETSKVLSLTPVDDSVYTGDTVVTITATDKAGVLTVASATAQILEDEMSAPSDTTAPVITLVGAATITLDWGSAYSDAGATATDNLDSSVTVNSSGTVNTAKPGVYTISYTASDAANNSAAPVVRTVIVSAPSTTPGADGVSGLLRYAFGANGPNDSVTKPTTVLIDGNLVLTAIVRVDNAKLTVAGESVTDLVNYASGTAITTVNGSSAGVDQTGVPAGCERQTFTVAQGGGLKKFLRLIATLAP